MGINYKKELESAAKSMILIHDPNKLIKLIVYRIVNRVKISHAGILLHFKDSDMYVLSVSHGTVGIKVPAGFARLDKNNPLIRYFTEHWQHSSMLEGGVLVYDKAKIVLKQKGDFHSKKLLRETLRQMEIFDVVALIPSYFRDDLLGILMLGRKKNGKNFAKEEIGFFKALASDAAMAIRNAQLFKDLESELEKKHRLFIHTSIALAAAIDAKDHYTHGHTMRVTSICLEIAKRLSLRRKTVIDSKFFENLHIAALLHDIGKIGISETILNKEGPLNDNEWHRMKEHTVLGANILLPISELGDAIYGVKYHHENFDGSGYPEGLKGEDIPLIAAIISVADVFDAMVTDRPYRKGMLKESAVDEIKRVSGKQLNPEVVLAFLELFQENKI